MLIRIALFKPHQLQKRSARNCVNARWRLRGCAAAGTMAGLAGELKEQGNRLYADRLFHDAIDVWSTALDEAEDVALKSTLHNNIAAAHLVLNNFAKAFLAAKASYDLQPERQNAKACSRAAQALIKMGHLDEGVTWVDHLQPLDPPQAMDLAIALERKRILMAGGRFKDASLAECLCALKGALSGRSDDAAPLL